MLWGQGRAVARPQVDLDVAIDPAARRVEGIVRLTVTNTSQVPLRDVPLWLYPNHLSVGPSALGDINYHWIYPGSFSPARITLMEVRIAGEPLPARFVEERTHAGDRTLARVPLAIPVPPGSTVVLDARFVTEIPVRLASFGCLGGGGASRRCRAMGGFYPFAAALGPQGWQLDAPPPRVDVMARVTAPRNTGVLIGDAVARSAGSPISAVSRGVPYATLIAGAPYYESSAEAAGVRTRFFHADPRPPSSAGEAIPYVREDIPGVVLGSVGRALAFLAEQGLTGGAPELVVVEAPLRHELVQVHGPIVLVSDQLFRIFPADRVRKFHTFALVRAVFEARLGAALQGVEADEDIDLSAEVLAAFLTDVFILREFNRIEHARDLLMPVAFLPAVDQLIYAPLVASASTYFGDLEADGPQDDVRQLPGGRPRGRLVYQKLLDLVGATGMTRLGRRLIGGRVPLRQAAAEIFGGDLAWFWKQWLGPPPAVNYRLASVDAVPRDGGGARVVIEVRREGADIREPVEVRVEDRAGGVHNLVWRDGGRAKRFEIDLPAPLASVELDPRRRLIESPLGSLRASDDPRMDNRDPPRVRLLYSGFGALLNVSNLTANFLALFTLKRQHELRNQISLFAAHSETTQIGVGGVYARLFGPQVNRNQLASSAFAAVRFDRLEPSFGSRSGGVPSPGWRGFVSVGIEHDDRDYIIDPWRAKGFGASVGYALTRLDDGQQRSHLSGGVEVLRLWELAPGHVLAGRIDVAATHPLGGAVLRSQLARAGGPGALRGYGTDELFGRARATARVELRNRFVSNLSWNLAHLTTVRALAGSLFAGAAALTSCESYALDKEGVFFEAGASVRILHDSLGVYQQLFSLDVAVPLNRHDRVCLGQSSLGARRPPFVVLITFLPPF